MIAGSYSSTTIVTRSTSIGGTVGDAAARSVHAQETELVDLAKRRVSTVDSVTPMYTLEVADSTVCFESVERVLAWLRDEHPGEPCRLDVGVRDAGATQVVRGLDAADRRGQR